MGGVCCRYHGPLIEKEFRLGEMRITPIYDGIACVAPDQFIPEADWAAHAHMIGEDGYIAMPVGGFIVRTCDKTILFDAGLGEAGGGMEEVFRCGALPAALSAARVTPDAIDIVACSHLHLDHAGWLMAEGRRFFPNAAIRFGAADWDALIVDESNPLVSDHIRQAMRMLEVEGALQPIEADGEIIAPGINACATPGHTPGHQTFILSSGDERLVILGDAIACPLQVGNPEWAVVSEVDPALATRSRIALMREIEGAQIVGPHFPDLRAGRLLPGEGRRYYSFATATP